MEISELGKMTPAEWQSVEGVVLVVVVARRLRGQLRGLLHGNGDDGERSVGSSNNTTPQEGEAFCTKEQGNGEVGIVGRRSIWKAATLSHFLDVPLVDAGAGGRWQETATSMFLAANPTWMGD